VPARKPSSHNNNRSSRTHNSRNHNRGNDSRHRAAAGTPTRKPPAPTPPAARSPNSSQHTAPRTLRDTTAAAPTELPNLPNTGGRVKLVTRPEHAVFTAVRLRASSGTRNAESGLERV
jgi:hypothetical protein